MLVPSGGLFIIVVGSPPGVNTYMIKVKLNDGSIIEVTKNVAHGIIEREEGVLYTHRMMRPKTTSFTPRKKVKVKGKGYEIK